MSTWSTRPRSGFMPCGLGDDLTRNDGRTGRPLLAACTLGRFVRTPALPHNTFTYPGGDPFYSLFFSIPPSLFFSDFIYRVFSPTTSSKTTISLRPIFLYLQLVPHSLSLPIFFLCAQTGPRLHRIFFPFNTPLGGCCASCRLPKCKQCPAKTLLRPFLLPLAPLLGWAGQD